MKIRNFTIKYTDRKTINSNNFVKFEVNWRRGSYVHTCEPSRGSIFLPILRVPSVPPVNFQNLPPVKKNKVPKNLDRHFAINISGNSPFGTPALTKNAEIRMVKVNVIFNDIQLLICLTPLQVNWFMLIN